MWVKSIKQLKRREVALVAGAIVVLGSSAWAIGQWRQPSVPSAVLPQSPASLGPLPPLPTGADPAQPATLTEVRDQNPNQMPMLSDTKDSDTKDKAEGNAAATVKLKSGIGINRQGLLRISNPTDYPVRVALLSQWPAPATTYAPPAHWDFDPEEGYTKGLLVGLPNQTRMQVKSGDVLVAFALDGSRRYWGPYVVGATDLPNWESKGKEWQLILQP
jgi:hypothetical protein